MDSRDIALISVFAAVWMVAQITLGPIIGRFSVGPVSFHGIVNKVVGWMLMVVLAYRSGRFGKVSTMTLIASLGTRIIRSSPLSGFVTGVGYALGASSTRAHMIAVFRLLLNTAVVAVIPEDRAIIILKLVSNFFLQHPEEPIDAPLLNQPL